MTGILSGTLSKYISVDILQSIGIDPMVLRTFLNEIEKCYNANPYHNAEHAESVMHACQCLFTICQLDKCLLEADLYHVALLVAAACHDVGHPGSLDRSFTEKRHVEISKEILRDSRCDFIRDCPEKAEFMQIFEYLIMNTAMDLHGKCLSDLNIYKRTFLTDQRMSRDACRSVLSVLLKCADLWHVILPWSQHERWTNRFLQECREGKDKNFVSEQVFFLQSVCRPCFQCLTEIFPMTRTLVQDLDKNLYEWKVTRVGA